jgi:hypothetical protein
LWLGDRRAGKDGIEGCPEVVPAHRDVVARAGAVELAPVGEPAISAEEEEVRRAGGVMGPRRLLRLVVQVRDREAHGGRHLGHLRGAVLGDLRDVVAADRDNPHTPCLVLPGEPDHFLSDVLDVRAVVAQEHDEQRGAGREIVPRDQASRGVGQVEVRGGGAQREHC